MTTTYAKRPAPGDVRPNDPRLNFSPRAVDAVGAGQALAVAPSDAMCQSCAGRRGWMLIINAVVLGEGNLPGNSL